MRGFFNWPETELQMEDIKKKKIVQVKVNEDGVDILADF